MFKNNKAIRNALIFLAVFVIFYGIDFLTKTFIFDVNNTYDPNNSSTWLDYKIIGFRSLKHGSTTFLDFINVSMPQWSTIMISLILAFIIVIFIITAKSKISVVGLTIILSGILGNTLDNIFFGYVRDILYLPWMDRGTFNFADTFVIFGLPFALIPMLFNLFKSN